jgi:Uma2 family endonuclease
MVVAPEKRRFTADEFLRMAQVGILCEDDRLELIDGEVVETTAVGLPHVAAVARPTWSCSSLAPTSTYRVVPVRRMSSRSSRSPIHHLNMKASIYANARIPEYWLVDLNASVLWRYLAPERGVFQSVEPA